MTTRDISSIVTATATPGRHVCGMPVAEYRQLPAINPSSLASGLIGVDDVDPCGIRLAWESPDDVPRTAATQDRLDRGTLAHLMVLQPELLMDRVAVWRGGRRASNEWEQFNDENPNKLIITAKDYHEVATATNAMRALLPVSRLLVGIQAEVAMFGSEPRRSGDGYLNVKGQVDAVNFQRHVIADLKTTEAGIDTRAVERTIRQFHYREKMACYVRWLAAATGTDLEAWQCYNVFMSLTPPYGVVVVRFSTMSLEWGAARMQQAIEAVDKCLSVNEWPMYCREIFASVEPWEMDDGDKGINYDE